MILNADLESYCTYRMLKHLGIDFRTMYFDLEEQCTEEDLHWVGRYATDTIIEGRLRSFADARDQDHAEIPSPNLLMALAATMYDSTVVIAGVKDGTLADKSPLAFREIESCLRIARNNTKIQVSSPVWKYTRAELVAEAMKSWGVTREDLVWSVCCQNAVNARYVLAARPMAHNFCGFCQRCIWKAFALHDNGISLPLDQEALQYTWDNLNSYSPEQQRTARAYFKWRESHGQIDFEHAAGVGGSPGQS